LCRCEPSKPRAGISLATDDMVCIGRLGPYERTQRDKSKSFGPCELHQNVGSVRSSGCPPIHGTYRMPVTWSAAPMPGFDGSARWWHLQATGFISAFDLEPLLRCLAGSIALLPSTRRSRTLHRLLALQIPLQVSAQLVL
jgi:hypothetical protein